MDDAVPNPQTQPSGALVPPPRVPPAAVATATPEPPPLRPERQPFMKQRSKAIQFLRQTFDAVDELADSIAEGLGLRPR
jgi:hypothetical protein